MRISKKVRIIALLLCLLLVIIALPIAGNLLQRMQGTEQPQQVQTPTAHGGRALYVSPQGDDASDGSQAHPFQTIQQAADETMPGTTVHVLPGSYTDPVVITKDGTASARITYISDARWEAKIKTSGSDDPWTTKADYIDIIGFDVTSTGSRDGIENLGSFIRTISNHVHDIPGGCDSIGGSGIDNSNYDAHDNDIIGNVVDHIGETYPTMCEYVHGIYHSNARGQIINNISYDNAGNGINLWHAATDTVVSNNLTFGNKEHGISIGTNTHNTPDGEDGDHFLVSNNIVIENSLLGIRERVGVGPHTQYLNNIVYGNGDSPFGDERYDWPPDSGSDDVNTITQDVQFVRFSLNGQGDYHPQAGSPAIDAGTSEGAPATDFDGKARPQGKTVDIGPYEYSS